MTRNSEVYTNRIDNDIDKIKTDVSVENDAIEEVLTNNTELEQYITNEN